MGVPFILLLKVHDVASSNIVGTVFNEGINKYSNNIEKKQKYYCDEDYRIKGNRSNGGIHNHTYISFDTRTNETDIPNSLIFIENNAGNW